MIQIIVSFFQEVYVLFFSMAPYLLLGLTVAGVLSATVTTGFVARHIGRHGFGSAVKAALLGVPLPLCSCGVVPAATYLRRSGASRPAVMSFLISTPQTGVDSIAASYGMLGPLFAVFRPIVAFATGLIGGAAVRLFPDRTVPVDRPATAPQQDDKRTLAERAKYGLWYGYIESVDDIAVQFLIGLGIAGLITLIIPGDFFTGRVFGSGLPAMLLMVIVGIPMYVCSTSSIPIAVALIAKGLSPGAAYVFLVAGPATNAATLAVLSGVLGRRDTIIYVASIIVGSLAFGPIMDALATATGWVLPVGIAGMAKTESLGIVEYLTGAILGILIIAALYRRWRPARSTQEEFMADFNIKVEGMSCNGCAATVKDAVAAVVGVENVNVDLEGKLVTFSGSADQETVADAIREVGYQPVV